MHRLNIVFLVTISIATLTKNAQTSARVIKGVVTDASSSAPIEGVTILSKGSKLLSESQTDRIYAIPIIGEQLFESFTTFQKFTGTAIKRIQVRKVYINCIDCDI